MNLNVINAMSYQVLLNQTDDFKLTGFERKLLVPGVYVHTSLSYSIGSVV